LPSTIPAIEPLGPRRCLLKVAQAVEPGAPGAPAVWYTFDNSLRLVATVVPDGYLALVAAAIQRDGTLRRDVRLGGLADMVPIHKWVKDWWVQMGLTKEDR
jgi:hypothetical protein